MGKSLDITEFMQANQTPRTKGFSHALDIIFTVANEMEVQQIDHSELAKRMDMSLDGLLDLMANFNEHSTLENIAAFELALGVDLAKVPQCKEGE